MGDQMEEMFQGDSFEDLLIRGTGLLHDGRPEEAVPLLKQAQELEPYDLDANLNLSGALILTRKFKHAAELLERMVKRQPTNVMLWINLGAAYLGNPVLAGDSEQKRAIGAFSRALELDPLAPSVAYNIGLIYRDRGEHDEAVQWFEQAVQANPGDKDARNILNRLKK